MKADADRVPTPLIEIGFPVRLGPGVTMEVSPEGEVAFTTRAYEDGVLGDLHSPGRDPMDDDSVA